MKLDNDILLVENLNNEEDSKNIELNQRRCPLASYGYFIIEPQNDNFIHNELNKVSRLAPMNIGGSKEKDILKR